MKIRHLLLLVGLLGILSCSESYPVFTNKYPCNFVVDTQKVPFNSIYTSGYFISIVPKMATRSYVARTPTGQSYTIPLNEIEARVSKFGLGGLLVGMPHFGEGQVYAYDLACANCDKASARLKVDETGIATCPVCKRTYDLNNNGMPLKGGGRPLYRYMTGKNGTKITLHN